MNLENFILENFNHT